MKFSLVSVRFKYLIVKHSVCILRLNHRDCVNIKYEPLDIDNNLSEAVSSKMDTVKSLPETFPDDIFFEVFVKLDMITVARLCQSCKRLLSIANRPEALKVFAERSGLPYPETFAELSGLFKMTKNCHARAIMIMYAARDGDVRVMNATLKLCERDFSLNDAMRTAAKNGHISIVKVLLSNNITLYSTRNGMACASENGHINIVKLLLYVDPSMGSRILSIKKAAGRGHIDIVKLLIDNGTTVNSKTIEFAAEHGYIDIVKLLLANGATVNSKAINKAAEHGYVDVVKLLLDNGTFRHTYTTV